MGYRIKELRKERNWTQEHLAALIGCSKGHVSEMEAGKKNPSNPLMAALSEAFGVPVSMLFDEQSNVLRETAMHTFARLSLDAQKNAIAYLEFLASQEASSSE